MRRSAVAIADRNGNLYVSDDTGRSWSTKTCGFPRSPRTLSICSRTLRRKVGVFRQKNGMFKSLREWQGAALEGARGVDLGKGRMCFARVISRP